MRISDPAGRGAQDFRAVAGAMPADGLVTVAQDYTVADTTGVVMVKTMRGPVTVTLPRAAVCSGRVVAVRKTDSGANPATIRSVNGETVGGATWVSLTEAGEFVQLQSDGSEWQVVVHF